VVDATAAAAMRACGLEGSLMARSILIIWIVMVGYCCGAGCAPVIYANAFDGPDLPDTDVARVELGEYIRLTSLNDKPVPGIPPGTGYDESFNTRIIRLLPGQYRLLVGMRAYDEWRQTDIASLLPWNDDPKPLTHHFSPGSDDDEQLECTVEAGRRYLLDYKRVRSYWFFEKALSPPRFVLTEMNGKKRVKVVSASRGFVPHWAPADR
jgi:hypothetical protein